MTIFFDFVEESALFARLNCNESYKFKTLKQKTSFPAFSTPSRFLTFVWIMPKLERRSRGAVDGEHAIILRIISLISGSIGISFHQAAGDISKMLLQNNGR